jgi:hypothetical protein
MKKIIFYIFVYIKYLSENKLIHEFNISNKKVINPWLSNVYDPSALDERLKKTYLGTFKVKKNKIYFTPAAAICTQKNEDQYLKSIGDKSRNMIKKAVKNNFIFSEFNWNEYLSDIYEINTSIDVRQGKLMSDSYKIFPRVYEEEFCKKFDVKHIGIFLNEKLVAYAELHIYKEITFVNRILGHYEYLKYGIMNYLIYAAYKNCHENNVKFLLYISMKNIIKNSLSAFKKRVGFSEYTILSR